MGPALASETGSVTDCVEVLPGLERLNGYEPEGQHGGYQKFFVKSGCGLSRLWAY
jgi:hypothetical protein